MHAKVKAFMSHFVGFCGTEPKCPPLCHLWRDFVIDGTATVGGECREEANVVNIPGSVACHTYVHHPKYLLEAITCKYIIKKWDLAHPGSLAVTFYIG